MMLHKVLFQNPLLKFMPISLFSSSIHVHGEKETLKFTSMLKNKEKEYVIDGSRSTTSTFKGTPFEAKPEVNNISSLIIIL